MATEHFDLIIEAGRVVDPRSGRDEPGSVCVRDGRICQTVSEQRSAERIIRCPKGILLPGLIDLHAHPACADSVFGVDPDSRILACGTTTVMSQGDAGADNIDDYLQRTIRASKTRVILAINLSRVGESTLAGCLENLEDADVDACVAAIKKHRKSVWGIAVNVSHDACGSTDPREVLSRGIEAAERVDLPILFGMRRPQDWPLADQLELLRPGDVVTYCFRREPHCIVESGRVLPEVRTAKERGILFDVGHGTASFDFEVAEAAIADGFLPDTISTDLQKRHIDDGIRHDLPLVMSKLWAAGMSERDVIHAVTVAPAAVLRIGNEVGTLEAGKCADLVVLKATERQEPLSDWSGKVRNGIIWQADCTIRAGEIIGT